MKKTKELAKIQKDEEIVSINIDTDKLPEIVSGRIEEISELEKAINASESSAKNAMKYVNTEMKSYKTKGIGIFAHRSGNTKDIIEDTQEAIKNLANAQQVSVKALQKSFEFHKKLADTSKYLFELGCANITVNRIAVRAIEKKLKGASKGEISELARQEMMNVVRQLKEQEDILKKQEFLTEQVKNNVSRLNEKDEIDKEQSQKIDSLSNENKKQNERISEINDTLSEKEQIDADQTKKIDSLSNENKKQNKKISEINDTLSEKEQIDAEQTKKIDSLSNENKKQNKRISEIHDSLFEKERIDAEQTQRLEELGTLLSNKDIVDQKQEEAINKSAEAIKVLFEYTKQKDILDKEQSDEIKKIKNFSSKKLCVTTLVISILALIFSVASIVMQIIK